MNIVAKWKWEITAFCIILLLTGGSIIYTKQDTEVVGCKHIHKPISLPKNIMPLTPRTLVYFGQIGCEYTCVPRMKEIYKIYEGLMNKSPKEELGVLLINLDISTSSIEADAFAKSFHPSFKGVSLGKEQLHNTLRMFHAYCTSKLESIEESSFLFLVKRDSTDGFYLNDVYTDVPFNVELVTEELIRGSK